MSAPAVLLGADVRRKILLPTREADGFTLIELLITISVILTICAIAVPHLTEALESAKNARATADIHTIGTEAQTFQIIHNAAPTSLADIGYAELRDPWKNPYQYLNFADPKGKGKLRKDRFMVPINSFFDLYSMGPDGQSVPALTAKQSRDDIVWANDGAFVGPASGF